MATATTAPPVPRSRRSTFHTLRVAHVERLCPDASAVSFHVPAELAEEFDFRAGQSVTLRRNEAHGEERRDYSICAAEGGRLRIGVRQVPEGLFSQWLVHSVQPGDEVEVLPPKGTFTPDTSVPGRHVLVAAGSGITPVLSIAASVLAQPESTVTLVYGNRKAETVMFTDELADLKDRYGHRLELVHVLSREPREAELFTGRLDAEKLRALLRSVIAPAGVDHWWLCGPYGMVTDAIEVLTAEGVERDRVHTELFYVDEPPEPVRHEEPGIEGAACELTAVLDGRATTMAAAMDTPVLDSAQRSRPDLPFACKGGVCGTCRAHLTSGEVRMRRNFALEPSEVEAGFVLTCQSLPVTEQVTVDYDV